MDRTVPVVTPNGANPTAYLDPTSPESLLRKTKEIQVQTAVDQAYDIKVSPYEGFSCYPGCRCPRCRAMQTNRITLRPHPLAFLNTPLTPLLLVLLRTLFSRR